MTRRYTYEVTLTPTTRKLLGGGRHWHVHVTRDVSTIYSLDGYRSEKAARRAAERAIRRAEADSVARDASVRFHAEVAADGAVIEVEP